MKHLLDLNKRGLIHAPDEPEEIFFRRCEEAGICSKEAENHLGGSLIAQEIFDISPDWIKIIYDNKGLRLWEGGCSWVGEAQPTLQLNKAFLKKRTYLGYTFDEVVAHEMVHVVRSAFEEPIFEEILAYQTSPSSFRRFFGPFFKTPKESFLLVGLLFSYGLASFFDFLQLPILYLSIFTIAVGVLRLLRNQRIFSMAKRKLSRLISKEKVLAVMLRLTDREIVRFSKMSEEELLSYVQKMTKMNLRWQQIFSAYFNANVR